MKPLIPAAAALMLAVFTPAGQAAPVQPETAGWFVPQLVAGNDADCGWALAAARRQFAVPDPDRYPPKPPLGPAADGMKGVAYDLDGDETQRASIQAYDLKVTTIIGCGQACNTGTVTVLAKGKAVFTTPEADSWSEYGNGKSRDYLVGVDGSQLAVYDVAGSGAAPACRVALEPDFKTVNDADVQTTLQAVDSLNKASLGMSRAGGDFCGSSQTPWRWEQAIASGLHRALYRPWAVTAKATTSENSYDDYGRILPQLRQWSLGGLSEHAAFALYKTRIAATETMLMDFYGKKFGWAAPKARAMAHAALTNAIASGFGFYMYKPFANDAEERLRTALFAHAPMAQIRAIPLDVQAIDVISTPNWPDSWRDSILDIAIGYPEALQYLLDKGFDPNRANAFGKTPLMYAAQYNRLEAARLLLKAGADPNARTTHPPTECGFTLTTFGMTPLHYAVRNAGAPLVNLLLASGAQAFLKTVKDDGKNDGLPLDWLRRYTGGAPGQETNPNLSPQDVAALAIALAPPEPGALARLARDKVLLAERQAAAGNDEAAYQAVTVALQADPDSRKGLADLPLLALKAGRRGEAAAAATRATTALANGEGKASAWFNLGLICAAGPSYVSYDATAYCGSDVLDDFLTAYRLAPTEGRAAKLVAMMRPGAISENKQSCARDGRFYRVLSSGQDGKYKNRVYILHRNGESVDPRSITWTVNWSGKPATVETPEAVGRYVLGDQTLTVMETPRSFGVPAMVNGQACGTY